MLEGRGLSEGIREPVRRISGGSCPWWDLASRDTGLLPGAGGRRGHNSFTAGGNGSGLRTSASFSLSGPQSPKLPHTTPMAERQTEGPAEQ